MDKLYLPEMPIFEFSTPSKEDLSMMGISDALYSPYNVKATYKGEIVGYITIQDRDINIPIKDSYTKEEQEYVKMLKSNKWYLIRKIFFKEEFKETGNLYNMFDYLVNILPKDCYLWTNIYWDRKTHLIDYIGGFALLPYDICNNGNIRIYSVYQSRNE